jgi:hypothetical protein
VIVICLWVTGFLVCFWRGIPSVKSVHEDDLPLTGDAGSLAAYLVVWAFISLFWPLWLPFYILAKALEAR